MCDHLTYCSHCYEKRRSSRKTCVLTKQNVNLTWEPCSNTSIPPYSVPQSSPNLSVEEYFSETKGLVDYICSLLLSVWIPAFCLHIERIFLSVCLCAFLMWKLNLQGGIHLSLSSSSLCSSLWSSSIMSIFMWFLLAVAAAKLLQSCPTLCDPIDGSHQAPPSLGFSRQEHWSGLPFPQEGLKDSFVTTTTL